MISAKEAITKALAELLELSSPVARKYDNLRLEQIEKSSDGQYWLVTLGYDAGYREVRALTGHAIFPTAPGDLAKVPRDYKLVTVRADSGEVVSIKFAPAA